jgi:hypothetical protein
VADIVDLTVAATIEALRRVRDPYYFRASERGYQGWLLTALESTYRELGLLNQGQKVEEENQKSLRIHGMRQRPDIAIHVPRVENSLAAARIGNLAAYALKRNAAYKTAMIDVQKLDQIVKKLDYKIGCFVNIGGTRTGVFESGRFSDHRIHAFAPRLIDSGVEIDHEWLEGPGNDPASENLQPGTRSVTWPNYEDRIGPEP